MATDVLRDKPSTSDISSFPAQSTKGKRQRSITLTGPAASNRIVASLTRRKTDLRTQTPPSSDTDRNIKDTTTRRSSLKHVSSIAGLMMRRSTSTSSTATNNTKPDPVPPPPNFRSRRDSITRAMVAGSAKMASLATSNYNKKISHVPTNVQDPINGKATRGSSMHLLKRRNSTIIDPSVVPTRPVTLRPSSSTLLSHRRDSDHETTASKQPHPMAAEPRTPVDDIPAANSHASWTFSLRRPSSPSRLPSRRGSIDPQKGPPRNTLRRSSVVSVPSHPSPGIRRESTNGSICNATTTQSKPLLRKQGDTNSSTAVMRAAPGMVAPDAAVGPYPTEPVIQKKTIQIPSSICSSSPSPSADPPTATPEPCDTDSSSMTSSRRSSESGSQPAAQQQQRCHQHHPLSTVNASFMRRSKCAACNPHAATSTTNGGLDSISTQGNASGGILTNRQRAASQSGSFQGSSGSSSGQSVVSGQRSPFSAASNEYGIANVTGPGHDKGSGTGPSANGANGANGGVPTGRLDSYYYFRRHGRLPSDENGPATNGRSWAAFEAHYFQSSHSASSIIDHSVRDYGKQPDTNTLPCKSKSHVERILSRSPTTPIPGADHPGSLTSDNASHEFPPDRRSLPATASASTSTSASASASASASGSESTHGANAGHAVALSYPTILGVQEQVTETPSDSRSTATTSASCSSQLMCSVEKNARQPQARFQQLLANSMSQSQHLAKLSQDLLSVSPNNLAKLSSDRSDPRYHQQMQECKAIVKSQKQMLDEMDSLLKAIEQTTTTVSESFIATPSSSISSDWMENKAAWMRWNVSRLIGGTVGTGDIVGYEKTADGMAVVVVAGTSVTTEASLLPKHLGPVQATAGVYHHRYILHLTRDDQKHNFALLPVSEWQPDHEAQQCELKDTGCSAQFGWLQRRHHCRKCGRVYCHTHSTNRLPLFEPQTERAHWSRVCDSCFYQLAGPHLINSSNSTSTSH